MKTVLAIMSMSHGQELTGDEVHSLADQFAEMQMRGEYPVQLFPLIQCRFNMCSECREEFEMLKIIQS